LKSEKVSGRREITRFRGGTNSLRIEMGKREGLKRSERMREVCGEDVEYEQHVMLDCVLYDDLRRKLGEKLGWSSEWNRGENRDKVMCKLLGSDLYSVKDEVKNENQEYVMKFMKESMTRRRRILAR